MMNTLLFALLKLVMKFLFDRKLIDYVIENVEFYMEDETMTSEEKWKIVKENILTKAKEIGVEITKSGANLLLEAAVSLVKQKV